MMITAVIIDDESRGRTALREKIREYCPEVELTGEAASGDEGIRLITDLRPGIVFLDIEMPRMDGFEMLHRLPSRNFHLVFTTAYDQYAIKAIKYAAFDYLLKPIDIPELQAAVARARAQSVHQTDSKLAALEQNLALSQGMKKIAIPTLEGLLFFNLGDIVNLEAQSNYTSIHFINHPHLVASKTLKSIEELLPAEMFFRPHHSHIINLKYVKRYIRGDGGQIEMENGHYVDVSRRKKDEFLKMMGY